MKVSPPYVGLLIVLPSSSMGCALRAFGGVMMLELDCDRDLDCD